MPKVLDFGITHNLEEKDMTPFFAAYHQGDFLGFCIFNGDTMFKVVEQHTFPKGDTS